MRVLMITGDTRFGPGHPRYDLQRSAVDELKVVFWGARHRSPFPIWVAAIRTKPDIVMAEDPFWRGLIAWIAARLCGARFIAQVHTNLSSQTWKRQSALARVVLKHADSVRVVSEKVKQQVGKFAPDAKVTVLPVYIDLDKFKQIVPVPHTSKSILWVGRFEDEKDPLAAIEIFKKVRAQGIDAKLIMLGTGALEQPLRIAAKGLPVDFPGWQDPLPYLAGADVVLCTSRHESWGASMVEALAAGVPVVAPDVGVAREAGAIVAPRETLHEAVSRVLTSGVRGRLQLTMPSREEWVAQWVASL
jgi:glycosyltransferase involved in cell wall biosynthesis